MSMGPCTWCARGCCTLCRHDVFGGGLAGMLVADIAAFFGEDKLGCGCFTATPDLHRAMRSATR